MVNSRKELVSWFNALGIQINRIEDLGKGTAICLLLSKIHPTFPSSFLLNPTNDYEYLKNMKIIQSFFIQHKIDMYFPVDKLVKCKLQDNLEVAQKLYKYYVNVVKDGRMEDGRVEGEKCNDRKEENVKEEDKVKDEVKLKGRDDIRKEIIQNLKNVVPNERLENERLERLELENERLREEVKKYKNALGELASAREVLRALEENRDFYFKKLVEIEKYLVECEEPQKETIFDILYRKE